MTLSIYDVSVPVFIRGLTALSWVLAKTETHFEGRDTAELMSDRIAADMLPFGFQISQTISHSVHCVERLTGTGQGYAPTPATLDEARKAVADAIAYLEGVKPEAFEGAEARTLNWDPRKNGGLTFPALPYLLNFATVNFYFHASIAYAIARKNGVPVGKADFMARGEAPANI